MGGCGRVLFVGRLGSRYLQRGQYLDADDGGDRRQRPDRRIHCLWDRAEKHCRARHRALAAGPGRARAIRSWSCTTPGAQSIATNDNWRSSQQTALVDAGLAPGNDLDSALITTLAIGSYTAIVRGANNTTGVALVEVYDLDAGTPTARLGNISTRGRVLTGR